VVDERTEGVEGIEGLIGIGVGGIGMRRMDRMTGGVMKDVETGIVTTGGANGAVIVIETMTDEGEEDM
jgi:hypothetical protein